MDQKPIPGYFYDSEKKRYFKILTASQGLNSAYSQDSLKIRKVLDIRKKQASILKMNSMSGIKPSAILRSTIPGGLLSREYGFTLIDAPRVLAAGLQPCSVFHMEKSGVQSGTEGCSLFDIARISNTERPSNFVVVNHGSKISVSMISSRDKHSTCGQDGQDEEDGPDVASPDAFLEIARRQTLPTFNDTALPTSVNINEHHKRVVSTLFGPDGGGLQVYFYYYKDKSPTPEFRQESITTDEPLGKVLDVFCSVSAPPHSSLFFAVGTNQGVLSICSRPCRVYPTIHHLTSTATKVLKVCHEEDIFAVEFLDKCPDQLLSGGRPGKLFLTDRRDRCTKLLMKHPSSITHIKSVDSNRIVVAGLQSSLCQYDLRFLKMTEEWPSSDLEQPFVTNISPSSRSPKKRNTISTQPIVTYHGYHNDATTGLGFDLDLDSRIIAAAQEVHEGHKPVQLFSLRDGSTLDSPCENLVSDGKKSSGNLVRSMRFVQENNSPIKSLYIGSGNIVQKYQWDERPVMSA